MMFDSPRRVDSGQTGPAAYVAIKAVVKFCGNALHSMNCMALLQDGTYPVSNTVINKAVVAIGWKREDISSGPASRPAYAGGGAAGPSAGQCPPGIPPPIARPSVRAAPSSTRCDF